MTRHLLLVLLACIAFACKKDKDSPSSTNGGGNAGATAAQVQFTINGDGFSNQAITINPGSG
ncbi:MAG: hypothetical protein IPJ85_06380 [Flavobacteriales bacterium]|nr:hypothetical protein [Flavobacteriales bacterium]